MPASTRSRKKTPARGKAAGKKTAPAGKKNSPPRRPEAPVALRRARPKAELRLAAPSTAKPQRPVQVRPSKARLMMPPVED